MFCNGSNKNEGSSAAAQQVMHEASVKILAFFFIYF